jgi:hypothetical protein
MTVEQSLRQKFNEILKLRRAYLKADSQRTSIGKTGNRVFEAFKKEFGASLKAKKSIRRPAKKLKPAPAGI